MKKLTLTFLSFLFISICSLQAQEDAFNQDVMHLMELTGSTETYDMLYDQLVMQMKFSMPDVSDSTWMAIKKDVFDQEVKSLLNQIAPIYEKYFTPDDIKAIIAFYESEVGKKLADKSVIITQETMGISQQWAAGLSTAIQTYLQENGLTEQKPDVIP